MLGFDTPLHFIPSLLNRRKMFQVQNSYHYMEKANQPIRQVPPEVYGREYFLTDCWGWEEWLKHKGRVIGPNFQQALRLARIKKGMTILDYGCGRGEIVLQSTLRGAKSVGIDYSKDAIDVAQEAISLLAEEYQKNTRFLWVKTKELPFENNTFDVIFFLNVIEHLYPEEVTLVLEEFYRILKPGGKLVVRTSPNKHFDIGYKYYTRILLMLANPFYQFFLKGQLDFDKEFRDENTLTVHVNEQTAKSVSKSLVEAGFKSRAWLSDWYELRNFDVKRWLYRLFFAPSLMYPLNLLFAWSIWGIGRKRDD